MAQDSQTEKSLTWEDAVAKKSLSRLNYIKQEKYNGKQVFQVHNDDGTGNYSIVAADNIPKEVVMNAIKNVEKKESSQLQLLSNEGTDYNLSGDGTIAGPQSGHNVGVHFSTWAWVPGPSGDLADDTIEFSGKSTNIWTGTTPTRGDINASDTFTYYKIGVGGTMTVSYPIGVGGTIEKSNTSATLNYPQINNWYYEHNYNGIKGKAFNIYKASQTSSVTFLLGNRTYSTSASDSVDIYN